MTTTQQLRDLAQRCREYQTERGLSDTKFCAKVPQVGSTKTYKRILDETDDLAELDLKKQLDNYQAALAYIQTLRQSERPPEPEYEDFSNIIDARAAVSRAMNEDTLSRFVVIEGENGTGKDAVRNALEKTWKTGLISIEATELWRESVNVPMADIIVALGIRRQGDDAADIRLPNQPMQRLNLIIDELKKRKLILFINEGHHMGPRALNLIKTIINQTPTVIVMACIPKLIARLIGQNYEEAIQLFGNRLCERVRLSSPPQDEILDLFDRRGLSFTDAAVANNAAAALAGEAPQFGNWAYVRDVARECRLASAGKPLDLVRFTNAKQKSINRRIMRQRA